ncbi:hypothetical protein [Nocardia sp. NPDC057030]|uniref:hypothetical protein n=1 Tax=unclassified Nocardia TaxID=2637762 RepID=UPI0036277556
MIVGTNWPAISPAYWRAMERVARDNAAGLDFERVDQARNAFDDRVRSSAGLQSIKDDMRSQQDTQRAFADALTAAADTFGDFAVLVDRTRNQILDIVDRATRDISEADDSGSGGTSSESQEMAARLLEGARHEVADVVRNSSNAINLTNLPGLKRIADALAQPSPWAAGHDTETVGQPSNGHRSALGRGRSDKPLLHRTLFGTGSPPTVDDVDGTTPRDESALPVESGDGTAHSSVSVVSSERADPLGVDLSRPADVAGPLSGRATMESDVSAAVLGPRNPKDAMTSGENEMELGRAKHATDDGSVEAFAHDGLVTTPAAGPRPITDETRVTSGMEASQQVPPAVAGLLPPAEGISMTAATRTTAGTQQSTSGSAAASTDSHAPPTQPRGQATRATAGLFAHTSAIFASNGKSQVPQRYPQQNDEARESSGGDVVRAAVGAAMAAAAAPAHLVGDHADGDLVLARTLLAGVLDVTGASVAGLQWAVLVLRHDNHVTPLLTSNEGRGWIPAGLLLPRAVSTPWVWDVADTEWEGIADPARVLAEFATVFGPDRGARMSALASSLPIDHRLCRQLSGVSLAGEVSAAAELDLITPQPGLIDRFGLIASPQAIEYVATVAPEAIGAKCADLAWDAHSRVAGAGPAPARSLGAVDVRQQILSAKRRGRDVSADQWDELREIDDLVAASQSLHRSDVSRSSLGELRGGRPRSGASDLSVVRDLTFQRRCNELVLLLAEEPTRQCLRDSVYAHAHIARHPFFTTSTVPSDTARPQVTVAPDC